MSDKDNSRSMLEPNAYRDLCRTVLERDRWTCQICGAHSGLEIHHIEFRSHGGRDSEGNLITLCTRCHGGIHGLR